MVEIQIIFGSNGGNTQLVCEYITDQLIELGHKVHLDPTYEHGSLEPNFLKHFWPRIQEIDLQQHACVVIGLGDIKYDIDYHIESARILQAYVETHNGRLVHPSLMVSGKVLPLLDKLVKGWSERLHLKLETL